MDRCTVTRLSSRRMLSHINVFIWLNVFTILLMSSIYKSAKRILLRCSNGETLGTLISLDKLGMLVIFSS